MSDTTQWYAALNGSRQGPFTTGQVLEMIPAGKLRATDIVWKQGMTEWKQVASVPELSSALPPQPPEPPPLPPSAIPAAVPVPPVAAQAGGAGNETSPSPPLFDKLAAAGAGVGVLCWLSNEFLGRGLLLVAGLLWLVFAARVFWTGAAVGFSGKLHRSGGYRIAAVVVALFGVLALIGGLQGIGRRSGAGSDDARVDRERHVDFGNEEQVYYRGDLRPQAQSLGQVLKEIGYFDGKSPKAAQVSRRGDLWVVHLYLSTTACTDARRQAALRGWHGVQLAALAFPDTPVEIGLCDESFKVRATIPVGPAGRVSVSPKEHVYYKGALREPAQKLAGFLRGVLSGQRDMAFVLSKRNATWVVLPATPGCGRGTVDHQRIAERGQRLLRPSLRTRAGGDRVA